jgi:hypothetical protein
MLIIDFVEFIDRIHFPSDPRLNPPFEKEGHGRFAELLADQIPLIPPFCKGGCKSLVLIQFTDVF